MDPTFRAFLRGRCSWLPVERVRLGWRTIARFGCHRLALVQRPRVRRYRKRPGMRGRYRELDRRRHQSDNGSAERCENLFEYCYQ